MSIEKPAPPSEHERYQDVINFEDANGFDELDLTEELASMKILWDTQNEEKLYAINERALHAQIQQRGRSVNRTLRQTEWIWVGINLFVAIFLTAVAYVNQQTLLFYAISAPYLAYALLFVALRRRRQQRDQQFAPTMLGDLDRAIWQLNYIVDQTRSMQFWYSLPLTIVFVGFLLFLGEWPWALALAVVMGGASYLATQWEINRAYLPQIRSLEALRAKLVAP